MVRETRYLQIGNIPENTTEDEISEYFKRYGRIQSVKLHPKKENETIHLATVAFTDIKSASTAHRAENKLKNNVLKTDFSEGSATGSVVTRTREPDHFQRTPASSTFPNHAKGLEEVDGFDIYYGPTQATFPEENRQFQNWGRSRDRTPRGSSVVGGGNFNKFDRSNSWQGSQQRHFPEGQHRTASFEQHSTEKETFERPKAPASPAHSTSQASSRHSSRKKHSPSQSSSSSSHSSSSSSSSGSRSRSRSNSSQSSSRSSVKKKVASTAQKVVPRTEIQDDKNSSQEVPESGEREPHGIYITHLPMRSSGTVSFIVLAGSDTEMWHH